MMVYVDYLLLPATIFIISLIALSFLRKFLISLLHRITSKTETMLDDIILVSLRKPSIFWIFAISAYLSIS
ncbi:MAG: hypothetical protein K6348_07205, partial [Deferribacterales bacterium]